MMYNSRALIAVSLLSVASAFAQTGPELLLKPLAKDTNIEGDVSATAFHRGTTDNDHASFRLDVYQLEGRVRIPTESRAAPRAGFNVTVLDLDTSDPALPTQYNDYSVGVGFGFLDQSGWLGGATIGVGYAAAGAFDDSNAYYGQATLLFGKQLSPKDFLAVVVDYNGNRTVLPDVPLPGFQYRRTLSDDLTVAVGFPVSSVTWKPIEPLKIEATYTFSDNIDATIDYSITEGLGVFASYASRTYAFHDDNYPDGKERMFFSQRLATVGVRYSPIKDVDITLAGGYAMGQRFEYGWDLRETDKIADLSDEPFARVQLAVKF